MRVLRTISALAIVLVSITDMNAQNNNPLLGAWEAEYEEKNEKSYVTYEFRNENGKLNCYTTYIKDDKGHGEKHESLAIKDVTFKGREGNGKYKFTYEGKEYEVKAMLKLENSHTLRIRYSAWGYSDNETWKRLK
ncbi:hypothetical protein [Ulvibacterium sp.]|uniref:hypothetical protein n=1 Tax=Ulvibacterium sp. TaxID=2665914 RepID=UPI003BAD4DC1